MSHSREHPHRCSATDCEATYPASYWDDIKAGNLGWFFQRDGKVWCPLHVPEWVTAWRARPRYLTVWQGACFTRGMRHYRNYYQRRYYRSRIASAIWGFLGIVCVLYIVELLWRAAT